MNVLAIDPGTTKSAFVLYNGSLKRPLLLSGVELNSDVLALIRESKANHLAVEMVSSYGMAVGQTVFETCVWIGRFVEAFGDDNFSLVYRKPVKRHLCGSDRAKDANVRQALIDKFGGDEFAVGGVKCRRCKGKGWFGAGRPVCMECEGHKWEQPPGPLCDIGNMHEWAALAVAVYWKEAVEELHVLEQTPF